MKKTYVEDQIRSAKTGKFLSEEQAGRKKTSVVRQKIKHTRKRRQRKAVP